jgi:apolipoprotein D and lipocalin family protein
MRWRSPLLVVVVVLVSAVTSLSGCGSDAPLAVASNVDLSSFQGKWYEIAKLPRMTENDCYGTTAFYALGGNGSLSLVNQCNVGSSLGPVLTSAMTATVPDSTVPAKLALQVGGYTGDYWILEVGPNYEYAVVGHPSRLYFWILGRSPSLDADTMQGILSRAETNQFNTSQLEYTPQPPAGERLSSATPVGSVPAPMTTGCGVARGTDAREGLFWLAGVGLVIARRVRRRRTRETIG